MSKYIYSDGAIHHDHHKEMTINVTGKTDLSALVKAFMADDAEEVEEVQDTTQSLSLPEVLQTIQAEELLGKLQQAGMVDERMQPIGLSNAEKGILAFELARRLGIQNQWQVFATLWGTTPGTLRSAYNRAIEQQKTMLFIEKIKNILD
jgi:hypothetical protein